jgi:glycosyltransferase involved in cell wall biosynthesis
MLSDLTREHRRAPFDVIHAFWAVPQGLLAAMARRYLGRPVLLHLPGGDVARLPEIGYGARTRMLGRLALRIATSAADKTATLSNAMVQQCRVLNIYAQRISLGVALDRWPVVPPRRRVDGAPLRLVHVADLSPVKDQETLLIAAQHLRRQGIEFVLDIVGNDTLHGAVQARARELTSEGTVRFLGFLPQGTLRKKMCEADILVVSSRHEAGPIVALEAAACGVPVAGTNVGLLTDWAPHAARVVDVGDGVALGDAVAGLSRNEGLRLRLAFQAQERAISENADVTTERIRGLYREMLAARQAEGKASPRRLRNS